MKQEFEEIVKSEGCVEVAYGLFMETSKFLINEHEDIGIQDKKTLAEHPYWIVRDYAKPQGFDSLEEAMKTTDRLAVITDVREAPGKPNLVGYFSTEDLYSIFGRGNPPETTYSSDIIDELWKEAENGITIDELSILIQEISERAAVANRKN